MAIALAAEDALFHRQSRVTGLADVLLRHPHAYPKSRAQSGVSFDNVPEGRLQSRDIEATDDAGGRGKVSNAGAPSERLELPMRLL